MIPWRIILNTGKTICLKCPHALTSQTQSTLRGAFGIGAPWLNLRCQRTFIPSKHKPTKKPPTKPLSFDYSGDLEKIQDVEGSQILIPLSGSQELDSADDLVKRLCSLEFADGQEVLNHRIEELQNKIRSYPSETSSYEIQIATLTVQIRNQIKHCMEFRKDKKGKSLLIERIQKRKKLIKFLRREDYPKFEWLMKELNINYVPSPEYPFIHNTSKRVLRKIAVKNEMYTLKKQKMADFKAKIEAEKEVFLLEKEQILAKVEEELEELKSTENELKEATEKDEERKWKEAREALMQVPIPAMQEKLKSTHNA